MRQIALALGVAATLVLAGCASNKGIDETGYSKAPLTDRQGQKLKSADAKRLYQAARDYLVHGRPKEALPLYAEVMDRFPFSPYASQSELETVTAHYDDGDYDQAVEAADRFIKEHPRNPNVDYVYYMRGLSNYAQNQPGLLLADPDKRNVTYLKQAFNDFSLLLKNYPNSVYAKDAQLHMIDIRNRVAKFNLRIANYYLMRHAYVAAVRRAQNIVDNYEGSTSVPRALEIMATSYAQLDEPELAEDTQAVLQASYPQYILDRPAFEKTLEAKSTAGKTTSTNSASPAPTSSIDDQSGSDTTTSDTSDNSAAANDGSDGWSLGSRIGTHDPRRLPSQTGNQ